MAGVVVAMVGQNVEERKEFSDLLVWEMEGRRDRSRKRYK